MKKIVMLGCENSHVKTFLKIMQQNPDAYRDVEVVGVYSHEREEALKMQDAFGVPVMEHFDEAVGKVDGIVVTARHGDNHYKYAAPYIASGIPMFIDKPITIDEDEAITFMRQCRDAGVRLSGGSCCKYADAVKGLRARLDAGDGGRVCGGYVRAPIDTDNPYGGFFFYSQHLVEMLSTVFGHYPNAVRAMKCGDRITVVFRYTDYDVVGLYTEKKSFYTISVAFEKEQDFRVADIGNDCFTQEFDEYCRLLRGGEQEVSYDDFIAPVFVLNAIKKSLDSGEEVAIRRYEV